jgi:hypothetical protein
MTSWTGSLPVSKLSKNQFSRFCGLLSVVTGKNPLQNIKETLSVNGYYSENNLTDKGNDELRRLATIAGLISDSAFDDVRTRKDFNHLLKIEK